jgi:hypothetical protein
MSEAVFHKRCDLEMKPVDPNDALAKAIRVTHQCCGCGIYTDGTYLLCDRRCCRKKRARGHLQLIDSNGYFAGLNVIDGRR